MDNYGSGALIEDFEREVAGLLGKEAAVFMPSGTMAQQIAMRIWSEQPRDEEHSLPSHLPHGDPRAEGIPDAARTARRTGRRSPRPHHPGGSASGIRAAGRPVARTAPARDRRRAANLGGTGRADQLGSPKGIPLHMDGARLWECGPFYKDHSYAEIAGLFDSVYVSFYKGLGGITGSILAGTGDFIKEARIWQRRYGGNLYRMWPYVLSARAGLRKHLPRMPLYVAKAGEVASALSSIQGVQVNPNPPHTNMMHVFLPGDRQRLLMPATASPASAKPSCSARSCPASSPATGPSS